MHFTTITIHKHGQACQQPKIIHICGHTHIQPHTVYIHPTRTPRMPSRTPSRSPRQGWHSGSRTNVVEPPPASRKLTQPKLERHTCLFWVAIQQQAFLREVKAEAALIILSNACGVANLDFREPVRRFWGALEATDRLLEIVSEKTPRNSNIWYTLLIV